MEEYIIDYMSFKFHCMYDIAMQTSIKNCSPIVVKFINFIRSRGMSSSPYNLTYRDYYYIMTYRQAPYDYVSNDLVNQIIKFDKQAKKLYGDEYEY